MRYEVCALQSQDSELGKKFLLSNSQAERATGQVVGLVIAGSLFNDRPLLFRW